MPTTLSPPGARFRSALLELAGRSVRPLRALAWVALVGLAGALVQAEAQRPALPEGVEAFTDIVYRRVGDRQARLDVYVPAGDTGRGRGRPAILTIHGGGWSGGTKDTYGREMARLARHGLVVVSVNYRLSRPGEPSWPSNFEDVREAVRWVRRHADDYGIDPDRIAALGSSAGGHLAALLGTYPESTPAPDGTSARVQAVINFYGPTDLHAILRNTRGAADPIRSMLGGTADRIPELYRDASPAEHASADDPPTLLIWGGTDRLIPTEQAEILASTLDRHGVRNRRIVLPELGHGFGLQAGRRDLVPDLLAFLDEVWNHDSRGR